VKRLNSAEFGVFRLKLTFFVLQRFAAFSPAFRGEKNDVIMLTVIALKPSFA